MKYKSLIINTVTLLLIFSYLSHSLAQVDCSKEEFFELAKVKIYDWAESKSFFFFESKMAVDADGSPRAYHPQDLGLDQLSSAGSEGSWWALATDNDTPNGQPLIQGENDPYPGYYISMTALVDRRYKNNDTRRYVDAEKIPYFVLNGRLMEITGAKRGDLGYVYNKKTKKGSFAIFADVGGDTKLGEGSIYLANQLGINSNPRTGGQADGVLYLVFPFSGNQQPRSLEEINVEGKKLMDKANAWTFLKNCVK